MESKINTAYTFKLLLASEVRRLTVTRETTFPQLLGTIGQLCQGNLPNPRLHLTWTDGDGDVITLRTQQDLDECFTFLDGTAATTLRITVATEESKPATTAPAAGPTAAATQEQEQRPGWGKGRGHGWGRRWEGREEREGREGRGEREGREGRGQRGGWHGRQKERLNMKLETKTEHLTRKLERMKSSPDFDPAEFARQVRILEEAGVEVLPLAEVLIARNIIHSRRRASKGHQGRRQGRQGFQFQEEGEGGAEMRACWAKKLEMLSEGTRQQLEQFRKQGLPSGPIMGLYLELRPGTL